MGVITTIRPKQTFPLQYFSSGGILLLTNDDYAATLYYLVTTDGSVPSYETILATGTAITARGSAYLSSTQQCWMWCASALACNITATPTVDVALTAYPDLPGLYNASGMHRFLLQRQNAGKTPAGVGLGGCGIALIGDSFLKGYNQSHPYRNTVSFLAHRAMQETHWQQGAPGGRGYVSGRSGTTAWPGGAATLSGQGIWTYDANWLTTSAASINNLRSTSNGAAQVRIFMDPTADPMFREATTDIAIVHGKEAAAGTMTFDIKFASTDTGFFTAGTGDITGTIDMNAATQGGLYTFPSELQGLLSTLTSPFILQISRTAGTIYFEGAHFFNGDKASGFCVRDFSRIGAATGDATFPGSANGRAATITKACSFGSTVDTCTAMFVLGYGINDCNQSISIDAFQTELERDIAQIDSDSTHRSCAQLWINGCLDEGLHARTPPWNTYKSAIKEVAAGIEYCSVLDFDELMNNPDTAAEVDVFEAFPYRYSTNATKHPSDEMAAAMVAYMRAAWTIPMAVAA